LRLMADVVLDKIENEGQGKKYSIAAAKYFYF
jgi:hypothetical protein